MQTPSKDLHSPSASCYYYYYHYRPEKNLLFSVASVIFYFILFYLFLSVYTITLERLNQSEPNFHTGILTEIAQPCTKMGITGHM